MEVLCPIFPVGMSGSFWKAGLIIAYKSSDSEILRDAVVDSECDQIRLVSHKRSLDRIGYVAHFDQSRRHIRVLQDI